MKKKIDFENMTLKSLRDTIKSTKGNAFTSAQILEIPNNLIYQLPQKELTKIANIMVSSSNKRIRRLLNNAHKGISEVALRTSGILTQKFGEKDIDEVDVRFFSVKNKNRNEVARELKRMIGFQRKETSTVKGAIERRKANEKLVFGETREERRKRELKEAKQRAKGKNVERPASVKDALLTPEFMEKNPELSHDDLMKIVFKHYRKYEETHSKIIKDMGSDFIIRMLGLFAESRKFNTMDDLAAALSEVDNMIETAWEQIDSEADADFFDQMEAYANGRSDKPPEFRKADGWN